MRIGYSAVGLASKLTVAPSSAPIYCSLEANVNAPSMVISSCFSPFDSKSQTKKKAGIILARIEFDYVLWGWFPA